MPDHITTCERAARAAGNVLMQWRGRFTVREKAPADLVTEADQAAEETILRILSADFPGYLFVGEESSTGKRAAIGSGDLTWFVDPLDGTTNYVHGLPGWCVSIGLVQGDAVVCGCVYDPLHERCFLGLRGEGAYLNGKRLRTSGECALDKSLVAISLPPSVSPNSAEFQPFHQLMSAVRGFRRLGSAALNLAYLAAGNLDGYWSAQIQPWDMAAGVLLVQEAGGLATSSTGERLAFQSGSLLAAATTELHRALLSQLGVD